MSIEIERKFLVNRTDMLTGLRGIRMRQCYLARGNVTVRVRITDERAWLTVKGATLGIARPEFEYAIPLTDAYALEQLVSETPIDKTRYEITVGKHIFEVDVFQGVNAPLVIAEIELGSVDEDFTRPDWLGAEVTNDPRYRNSELAVAPFSTW